MDIASAISSYEQWLTQFVEIIPLDIERKHRRIADDAYAFFRGTYYRWAQLWAGQDEDLRSAPTVLAVGDLHVENFGTWRDLEGRLIWGINDFDEAFPLPYTQDLVRLTTAVAIARQCGHIEIPMRQAEEAILAGYRSCLQRGPKPFVIEGQQRWLRDLALEEQKAPRRFWRQLEDAGDTCSNVPRFVRRLFRRELPHDATSLRILRRVAGMGTLGLPRYVGLASWAGSPIAREVKRLPPPAVEWVHRADGGRPRRYSARLARAHPHPDPSYTPRVAWLVKRLAPDCTKVKLRHLDSRTDCLRLLEAMGYETANVHLGSVQGTQRLVRDLESREQGWLKAAAKGMAAEVLEDHAIWASVR